MPNARGATGETGGLCPHEWPKESCGFCAETARLTEERDAWKDLAEGRASLLVCYRTGSHARADKALDRIRDAENRIDILRAVPDPRTPTQ